GKRLFFAHSHIGGLFLGTVANEAAMLALDEEDENCQPGDVCYRSDVRLFYRCISNYGANVGDWEVVGSRFSGTKSIVLDTATGLFALDGDETSPGADQIYGTDGAGNKGWFDAPSG